MKLIPVQTRILAVVNDDNTRPFRLEMPIDAKHGEILDKLAFWTSEVKKSQELEEAELLKQAEAKKKKEAAKNPPAKPVEAKPTEVKPEVKKPEEVKKEPPKA